MKKLIVKNIVVFSFLIFLLASCDDGSEPYIPPVKPPVVNKDSVVNHERAKEIFDLITRYYKQSNGFYKESYPAQAGDPSNCYVWPYVATVSGACTLHQLGYDVNLIGLSDNYEKYYRTGANGNSIGGYGSSTDGFTGGGTRFYDDNSIIGISLIEAYNVTKEQRFLDRASRIVAFLESGVDGNLGGALWWNEDQKNIVGDPNSNKPTCSNGYATLFLMEYYKVCPQAEKPAILNFAKKQYAWLKSNLLDPSDKCYWNDMNASGEINKTKWTYNTGVMVQNGIRLYQATGDQAYLDDAIASAQGAYDSFVKSRNNISLTYPDHDPWFNTKLLRAFIDIVPYYPNATKYIDTYSSFINNGYSKARTDLGFFYEDWTGASPKRYYMLLNQSAVVESYGSIALFKKEIKK